MPTKGFFASLFDLSFSSLVTTKVIKFIYVLTLVVLTLFAVVMVLVAFHASAVTGALTLLIVAPLWWLLALVYTRIALEFVIALFRIMETNGELVALKRQQLALAGAASAQDGQ